MKATEQYFSVLRFTVLYKVVPVFDQFQIMGEILSSTCQWYRNNVVFMFGFQMCGIVENLI